MYIIYSFISLFVHSYLYVYKYLLILLLYISSIMSICSGLMPVTLDSENATVEP